MHKFSLKKITKDQKKLRLRILELSNNSKLSHLGSCFSSVDLIDAIYQIKKKKEKFVLSNGHAGIALYSVLEKYGYFKNPEEINKLGVHPDRNLEYDIHVSTGSLGQGLPIALGMALADKTKNVYCLISDGECAEGSIWEALRITKEKGVNNLKIIINANGWSAYDPVEIPQLIKRIKGFGYELIEVNGHNINSILSSMKKIEKNCSVILLANTTVEQFPFLKGLNAHYYVMNEQDYNEAKRLLI